MDADGSSIEPDGSSVIDICLETLGLSKVDMMPKPGTVVENLG